MLTSFGVHQPDDMDIFFYYNAGNEILHGDGSNVFIANTNGNGVIVNSGTTENYALQLTENSNDLFRVYNSGNVVIGVTNTDSKMSIEDNLKINHNNSYIKLNTTDNLNVKSLSSESWSINIESELQNLNQAYLINFTAAWCITCQANDKLALSRPGVVSYLQKNNIRYIKADWTNRDNDILKALTAYGRTGVPLYLYWKPGLNETKILPAVLTEELLLNSL